MVRSDGATEPEPAPAESLRRQQQRPSALSGSTLSPGRGTVELWNCEEWDPELGISRTAFGVMEGHTGSLG